MKRSILQATLVAGVLYLGAVAADLLMPSGTACDDGDTRCLSAAASARDAALREP